EIIINKKLNIRGNEVFILSLTKDDEYNKLWVIQRNKQNENNNSEIENFLPLVNGEEVEFNYYEEEITNRENLINDINNSNNTYNILIKEIEIQGKKITFESSSSSSVECCELETMLMFNYFIKKGMVPSEWDELDIGDMTISTYLQSLEEDFPKINSNEKVGVNLVIEEEYKEVLIQHTFTIEVKKYEKDTKIEYIQDGYDEKQFFYLNEVEKYDIWKELASKLELNSENIEEDIYSLECECPKEMDLLAISYENKENEQLRFITKEYLNSPVYSEGDSIGAFFLFGNKIGQNGCDEKLEYVKAVEKDFNERLEIELFSKYVKVPSETIYFEI
ncbi:MAG: hypothetical protein ACRCXA_10210, partial [Peptostreptococcaceae bacterium]